MDKILKNNIEFRIKGNDNLFRFKNKDLQYLECYDNTSEWGVCSDEFKNKVVEAINNKDYDFIEIKNPYKVIKLNEDGNINEEYIYLAVSPYEAMCYHKYNLELKNSNAKYCKIKNLQHGYNIEFNGDNYWVRKES